MYYFHANLSRNQRKSRHSKRFKNKQEIQNNSKILLEMIWSKKKILKFQQIQRNSQIFQEIPRDDLD